MESRKVSVPKDVRGYEEKIKFFVSFTYREWIAVILTIFTPYFINRQLKLWRTPDNIRSIIVWGLITLYGFYGWFEMYGMRFEKITFYFGKWLCTSTRKRFTREGDVFEI